MVLPLAPALRVGPARRRMRRCRPCPGS